MTLWWIGNVVLLVVVLPVVVYLLSGVLEAARSIVPTVRGDRDRGGRRARRTSTPPPLLLTTQDQVKQTVAGVADYGGSLDVILDDAEPADDAPRPAAVHDRRRPADRARARLLPRLDDPGAAARSPPASTR